MANESDTHTTSVRIKVGQINCMRSTTVLHEVRKFAEDQKLDIVCMQEAYTKQGKIQFMPLKAQKASIGDNPMAVTVLFNNEMKLFLLRQFSDEHCVCVEVLTKVGKVIIANLYCQFNDDIEPYIEKMRAIFLAYRNEKVVVVADANAKSVLWNSPQTDERGALVEDIINELQLIVHNRPGNPPTFQNRAGAASNIDISISNVKAANLVKNWKVVEHATTSDHNFIVFELANTANSTYLSSKKKYNLGKANWEQLKAEFLPPRPILRGCNVHEEAKHLTAAIRAAMDIAIPKVASAKSVTNTAWKESLTRLRSRVRLARKRYQRCGIYLERQRLLQEYRDIKSEYKREIVQTKAKSWEMFVSRNLELDMWGVPYKIVSNKIKSPIMLSTLLKEDGSLTESWEESADILLDVLLPPDDLENETEIQTQIREAMIQRYETPGVPVTEEFTENEIRENLRTMKKRKAPGPDNIHVEILQALHEQVVPTLVALYNECVRQRKFPNNFKQADVIIISKGEDKDPTQPKSYRPICLLNTMGKLFEKLLCARLNHVRSINGLHPDQYGYRSGKSTEDAINKVYEIVDSSEGKYVMTVFIDISGAFDNLWWPAFFERLRRMRCPGDLYGSFRNYCQDRYASLSCPNAKKTRHITKGCPQGSVCGPIFWDLMLEELLGEMTVCPDVLGCIAYADDLLLIIDADSRRQLEGKANDVLQIISNWTSKVKLSISQTKTVYSLIKGRLERDPIIRIDGRPIRRTSTAKYLGIVIDEPRLFSKHITSVCEKATRLMHGIASLAQRDYRVPFRQVRVYLSSILASIIGYGASTWAHRLKNVKNREKVDRAQRGFLVRMTGAFSTTPTEALTVLTGVLPLHLEITRRGSQYWLRKHNPDKVIEILGVHVHTRNEINNVIERKRQNEWDASVKGRRLYQYIPRLNEIPPYFNPKPGLVHFLTGHGPYPSYLHRFSLKQDDLCECGQVGTPEHAIFDCDIYEDVGDLRQRLQARQIAEILNDEELYNNLNDLTDRVSKKQLELYNQRRNIQRIP